MTTGKQEVMMDANLPPSYQPNPSVVVQQQTYQPAYAGQMNTVVVAAPQTPVQNVILVQTVTANLQKPGLAPGCAFCKFAPGVIETVIRVSLAMMLLLLICVAAATIDKENEEVVDDGIYTNTDGWAIATGWITFVASLALITELIMLLLHFLNPSHFNNTYGAYGGLDIAKCVIAGVGLFIGCCITGVETAVARDDLDEYCDGYPYTPENNEACAQIEDIYGLVLAATIINVICMLLLLVLFVWDIVFLSANFKSKIPVPRVGDQVQQ